MSSVEAVRFTLYCPFPVSFRYPVASTYGRTYQFPTPTVLKGLIENACGFPPDALPFADSVDIALIAHSTDTLAFEALEKVRIFSQNSFASVKDQPHRVDFGHLGGGTYIRQFLPPGQQYTVYLRNRHPFYPTNTLAERIQRPFRAPFLGQSDTLVAIEEIEVVSLQHTQSEEVDSWVAVTEDTLPIDLKQVRGRVPLRFNRLIEEERKRFSRVDVLLAVGLGEPVRLRRAVACFRDGDRHLCFVGTNEKGPIHEPYVP
ncbi:MAG: CRISPR-associated protein Cas5 [Nitrospiraceae bacterium]